MPPLSKQNAVIPLLGMDTAADEKSAPPGTAALIANMYFRRTTAGGAELLKRNGGTALTRNILGGGSISVGRRLATFNDERLLLSGDKLYSYSPTLANWVDKGSATSAAVSTETIAPDTASSGVTQNPDVAVGGGYMAVAFLSNIGVCLHMIDLATGTRILDNSRVTSAEDYVRIIALSDRFVLLTWTNGIANVTARTILYATPTTVSGGTAVVTDLNVGSSRFDAAKNGPFDQVICGYNRSGAGLKILLVNANLTTGASATDADIPGQCLGWLHWDGSDTNMYLAYVGAVSGAKVANCTTAGAITSKTVVDATVGAARNVTGYRTGVTNTVFIEVTASPSYNTFIRRWPGSGTAAAIWQRSMSLGSRAWATSFGASGAGYVTGAYESPLQSTYFVLDGTQAPAIGGPPVVAKWFYGLAGGDTRQVSCLNAVVLVSGSTWAVPCVRLVTPQQFVSSNAIYAAAIARIDFSGTGLGPTRKAGEQVHLAGGILRGYDGRQASECGFHHFPETPTVVAGGGGAYTGVYLVCTTFLWVDDKGQVHESSPSAPVSVTLTAQVATITQPTLRVTDHPQPSGGSAQTLYVALYRTLPADTTFYLDSVQVNVINADTTAPSFQTADGTLPSQQKLYTTGGVLPRLPPPPCKLLETWQNRLFLAGTDVGNELWVSNEWTPGQGMSFSDQLVIDVEQEGGPITALAELDDRLVIFKESAIYTIQGAGPALNGAGQFDTPTRVTAATGAVSQGGVAKTSQGVLFRSARGWHMLPKGGGEPIRLRGVELYEIFGAVAAVLVEGLEQVRVFTTGGHTLVYHYGLPDERGVGRWTTFTGQLGVDAISWNNGVVAYLASDGTVTEEGAGYADPAGNYTCTLQLVWMNLAGLFGRLFLYGADFLADYFASTTVSVRIGYDYNPATPAALTKAVTAATFGPLHVDPGQGHVQSVQLTLEETSNTQGIAVTALGLEVGLQPGFKKYPGAAYLS